MADSEADPMPEFGRALLAGAVDGTAAGEDPVRHVADLPPRRASSRQWPHWADPDVLQAFRDRGIEAPTVPTHGQGVGGLGSMEDLAGDAEDRVRCLELIADPGDQSFHRQGSEPIRHGLPRKCPPDELNTPDCYSGPKAVLEVRRWSGGRPCPRASAPR